MRIRTFVVVGLVGLLSLAANKAIANDAIGPSVLVQAVDGVSFADPEAISADSDREFRFSLDTLPFSRARFASADDASSLRRDAGSRTYELSLSRRDVAGFVDVEIAQRASIAVNEDGEISQRGRASELRLGRGLGDLSRRDAPTWDKPVWYIFAASEDEALTWQPGARSAFGGAGNSFALQDRVEIGDVQAGVTVEAGGVQASLAYVEREISTFIGARTISQREGFTGLTLTMRR